MRILVLSKATANEPKKSLNFFKYLLQITCTNQIKFVYCTKQNNETK